VNDDSRRGPRVESSDAEDPKAAEGEQHDDLLRLASTAAHQLKSPLSAIQAVLATVMGGFAGPLQPRQRWLLEKAWERCSIGIKLVKDLLRLRGIEQIDDDMLGPVSMPAVFAAATDRFRDVADERNVEIEFRCEAAEPDLTWVRAETGLVREILSVLLDNAIKYTPAGGRVVARLFVDDPTATGGSRVCVEVEDTGIGIPPEGYENLFQKFYRAPRAKRISTEGSGLGLAFAYRATRRLGGDLHLEPSELGGVRAVVAFPQCTDCAEEMRGLSLEKAGEATSEELDQHPIEVSQRVVVIGGVAAGSKAAAKIMRLDPCADVTIVERGKFLAYSGCGLPYYISGAVAEQQALLETPLGAVRDSSFFHELKNVRALDLTEAIRIDREDKVVTVRQLIERREYELPYDRLVLAMGARPVLPRVPGVELDGIHTLHGVEDAEAIRNQLRAHRVKDVVIVGAGLLGCQITEAVALRGARITLVETKSHILDIVDPEIGLLAQRHLESHGVKVLTDCSVVAFEGEDRVRAVQLQDGRSLPCDFVLLTAGLRPEASLAEEAGLEIGPSGAIKVDRQLRTTDPDIYAVGDCTEHPHLVSGQPTWLPGAAPASIQGRVAAVNVCGGHEEYPGSVGTLIVKLFDVTLARTGPSEQQAEQAGFQPVSVTVPGPDRAHFIPTARSIVLKLMADKETRKLLGAQAVGPGDIAKRIDTVATALTAGLDLDGFAHLNLSYAPPYAMAMDNVITACNVLRNRLDGQFEGVSPLGLRQLLLGPEPPALIDVRLPAEFRASRLRGSRHIPLGALRSRLRELPRDQPIVLICSVGLRGYEASLILKNNGFADVKVLDGGLDSWPFALDRLT
jgi:NADPH-dependent 2,4-dienoyl-CoA reductase/sulfur reductase-like enzyme/rhodanese-related sulfurtransferase